MHGASSYIIQSKTGQLIPTHSISAGKSLIWSPAKPRADVKVLTTTLLAQNTLISNTPAEPNTSLPMTSSVFRLSRWSPNSRVSSRHWSHRTVSGVVCNWPSLCQRSRTSSCKCSSLLTDAASCERSLTSSCLSGNGAKDVAEVLLTLKDKKWADKLDWHVAPSTAI